MNPPGAVPPEPADSARPAWASLALFAIVLGSRLPFLEAGYGLNLDAWRVAWAARHIAETGEYVVSRFPGYPLHELSCALLWRGGPLALNGLSALASAGAAVFFYCYLRSCRLPLAWLAALTLAFVPVVFVNSVSAKDYVVALAFLMAALCAAGRKRAIVAGLLLGLATGFRPVSIVFGLPLAIQLLDERDDTSRQVRTFALFAGTAALTALFAFAPVILRYGRGFLRGYPYEESWATALRSASVGTWGALGCVGLAIAVAASIVVRSASPGSMGADRKRRLAWTAGLLVGLALFIAMPYQPGYLIPAIPFVILLLGHLAPRWGFTIFCASTMLASFVDFDGSGLRPGAILEDRSRRNEQLRLIEEFVAGSAKLPGKVVFVVGGQHALVSVLHPELIRLGDHHFAYLLDRREAADLVGRGYRIVSSTEVNRANILFQGVDLKEFGAVIYDAPP